MPYPQTTEHLRELIQQALQREEIRKSIDDLDLSEEWLIARVAQREKEVWAAGAKAIEDHDKSEAGTEAEIRSVTDAVANSRSPTRSFTALGCASFVFTLVGLFLIASQGYESFEKVLREYPGFAAVCAASFLVMVVASNIGDRRHKRLSKSALELETQNRQHLSIMRATLDLTIIERGILTHLREAINEQNLAGSAEELTIYRGSGLGEIYDPAFDIPTEARKRVESLLARMPGGSIGIAGSRGAGKTTLMSYICGPQYATAADGKILSLITPVPVQYEARDFVLHLFALLCRRVLRAYDAPEEPVIPQPTIGAPISTASVLAGSVLIIAGAALMVLRGFAEPEPLFTPVALMIAGAGLLIYSRPRTIERLLRLAARTLWRNTIPARIRVELDEEPRRPEEPIVEEARERLEQIRFQHSYSSGWGGALKLPIGIDVTRTTLRSYARQQRSLPEIVAEFREFAEKLTREWRLIIGIDELDKIEEEKAHIFLNQVKALFGIGNCFYLLSVSENAVSSFERRGLPIRNVLDSTFDTMVHVDYLTLGTAAKLLRRRVIGLSMPFITLCHVMSGGLPRDLIRACRDLIERSSDGEKRLVELAKRMIVADIRAKARATVTAARNIYLEQSDEFYAVTRELDGQTHDSASLMTLAGNILEIGKTTAELQLDDRDDEERDKLLPLINELATYIYYSATLLEFHEGGFFRHTVDAIELLADARRAFALRPMSARRLVDAFRNKVGLPIPPAWS